jgi:hypothetical protein
VKNTLRVPDRLPPPQRQLIEAFVTASLSEKNEFL